MTHHRTSSGDIGTGCPYSGEYNAAKAAIANLFEHFEAVLKRHVSVRLPTRSQITGDCHIPARRREQRPLLTRAVR